MRHHLTALACCLAIATPASAKEATQFRWMGDMTCGGWRATLADINTPPRAVLLNWVLGVIVGRSALRGDNLLHDVEVSSVAAWLDDYCAAKPLDTLIQATFALEIDLVARLRS